MARGEARKADQTPASLTWGQVMRWRLSRHHLDERATQAQLLEVVAGICGLHAQLMSSAELSLWARVSDLDAGAVQRALWEERSLVKSWAMRGTLHLLPSAEYPLWQAALGTYRHYLKPAWARYFGVTPDELETLLDAISRALHGRMLTREELAVEVSALTGSEDLGGKLRESWGALLKPAAFRGLLCFAPSSGQNVRFTHPGSWLPDGAAADPDRALSEVARRFLLAYAPATREDFARWWGTTPAHALRLVKGLGEEAVQVDVEGRRAWMLAGDAAEAEQASPPRSIRLLPAFDPYVIGATLHADSLLPGDFRDRIYRPQAWISPVLLVDGRMDGIWRHERRGKWLEVVVEPFVALPAWATRAVEEEAGRLASFLGGELELRYGDQ